MSKILKLPNAKPITCACCGCVYEFERGDNVDVSFANYMRADGKVIVVGRKLECPFCNFNNEIEFEKENEPNGKEELQEL